MAESCFAISAMDSTRSRLLWRQPYLAMAVMSAPPSSRPSSTSRLPWLRSAASRLALIEGVTHHGMGFGVGYVHSGEPSHRMGHLQTPSTQSLPAQSKPLDFTSQLEIVHTKPKY
eukprot:scaffold54175_cov41-Prasinocladus_malaysianus.AAC.2